jgi:hypothetical protein
MLRRSSWASFLTLHEHRAVVLNQKITSHFKTAINQILGRQLVLLLTIIFLSRLAFALVIWRVSGPSGFLIPDTTSYVVPANLCSMDLS